MLAEVTRATLLGIPVDLSYISDVHDLTGMTPSDLLERMAAHHAAEQERMRQLAQQLAQGTSEMPERLSPEAWEEERQRDLLTNFLYPEYLRHCMQVGPASWRDYTYMIAGRALLRAMTRAHQSHAILYELFPEGLEQAPDIDDVQLFLLGDDLRETDPTRFCQRLFAAVPHALTACERLLDRYEELVKQTWDKQTSWDHRLSVQESPLPGDPDFLYEQPPCPNLEAALDMYVRFGNLEDAAREHNVSRRRLKSLIDERGIRRTRVRTSQ